MRNTEIQTRGLHEIHDRTVGGGWWRQIQKYKNTEIQTRGLDEIHERPVGGGWWRQMRDLVASGV